MKKLIIAIMAVFAFNTSMAQEISKKEQRRLNREEKQLQTQEAKAAYLSIVRDSAFTIETTSIMDDNLYTHMVSPNTNFISIEGDEFVLQTANNFGVGYNGLGGITVRGDILEYEIIEGKENQQIQVVAKVISHVTGNSTLNIFIGSNGNATARLLDFWGNRITFNGIIIPLSESSVFQGQTVF